MKTVASLFAIFCSFSHAELVFDSTRKEINADPGARIVICNYFFENKGQETVTIAGYKSTCSCMTVMVSGDGKLDYAPGEKGVMRTTFDMENFAGEVEKNVLVWMKGDPEEKPSILLVTHVNIPVLVDMQPRTLEWSGAGPWETKTMKIEMRHTEPIQILRTSIGNPSFSHEMKTIEAGKSYEIVVTPKYDPATQPGMAVIHIETDCKIDKQKRQMAFVSVRPDLPKHDAPQPAPAPQLGPAPAEGNPTE
jgi:hypothetical protein